jgi:predicted LPLAT superfamily acyltransferase
VSGDIRVAALRGVDEDALAAAKTTDRGAFVVTAHLGNPEVIRAVADLNRRWRVNVLVHTRHAEHFDRLLARIAPDAGFRLIQVADLGVDKAILLKEDVDRGEWVVSVADRIPVGAPGRVTWVPFLGEPAPFSQGPFILASVLEIPIFTMFSLREDATYRVWFEKLADGLQLRQGARDELLREVIGRFVARLEARLVQAPLQWFNFLDFWHPPGLEPPHQRPSTLPHSHGKHEDSGRA